MADLPVFQKNGDASPSDCGDDEGACGSSCGNGLEKIYPSAAVRYGAMRWIGEFSYRPGQVFTCGGKVVISTDRGVEIGEQVSLTCGGCSKSITRDQIKRYIDNSGPEFYKLRAGRILREATPQDLLEHQKLNETLIEDIDRASLLAAQLSLDLKIVTVEHLLGGERIVFYFCAEGRIDFRELVKHLAHHYQTRIQMVQVGARDEARLVADYEICGRECCCKNFLKKLRPVNMKMAKLQKSTLDPTKVSGRCGRLRCCLRYEHDGYEILEKKLPRVNTWVETENGVAQVVDRQILTQLLLVRGADGREVAIPLEEVRATNVPPPPPMPIDAQSQRPPRRGEGPGPRGRDGTPREGPPERGRDPRPRGPEAGRERRGGELDREGRDPGKDSRATSNERPESPETDRVVQRFEATEELPPSNLPGNFNHADESADDGTQNGEAVAGAPDAEPGDTPTQPRPRDVDAGAQNRSPRRRRRQRRFRPPGQEGGGAPQQPSSS